MKHIESVVKCVNRSHSQSVNNEDLYLGVRGRFPRYDINNSRFNSIFGKHFLDLNSIFCLVGKHSWFEDYLLLSEEIQNVYLKSESGITNNKKRRKIKRKRKSQMDIWEWSANQTNTVSQRKILITSFFACFAFLGERMDSSVRCICIWKWSTSRTNDSKSTMLTHIERKHQPKNTSLYSFYISSPPFLLIQFSKQHGKRRKKN